MEKTSIDILSDFAKKNEFKYWSDILPTESILPHRGKLINTKFFVLKYQTGANSYYFCASDKGANATYSGLFANYSKVKTPELTVSPRFWIDHFIIKHKKKSGISALDKKISINCSSEKLVKSVLNPRAGNEFVRLSKKITPTSLVIEDNDLNYNPELEWESIIGIKTNRWITEEKELNLFLEQGSKLLDLIKKN
jgi:hypothetical protein